MKWYHCLTMTCTTDRWLLETSTNLPINIDECHYCNTTPDIGNGAKAKLPPVVSHVKKIIRRVKPKIVIACGKQAAEIVGAIWDYDLFVIPHPCYRVLTDDLLIQAGRMLAWRLSWLTDNYSLCENICPEMAVPVIRTQFLQRRGSVEVSNAE